MAGCYRYMVLPKKPVIDSETPGTVKSKTKKEIDINIYIQLSKFRANAEI